MSIFVISSVCPGCCFLSPQEINDWQRGVYTNRRGFLQPCGHECNNQPQIIPAYLPTRGGSTTSISSDRMCVSTASLLSLRLWSFYHSWFPLEVFQSKTSATDDLSEFTLLANEERRLLCYFVYTLSTLASFESECLFNKHGHARRARVIFFCVKCWR